ncbi:MAG TPA: glycosyltransferase family 87 protein, partial [Bacteroidia bacterium]|nr:glycosyltransferase family 87 protein [Bacteroidia bacterium]
QKMPATEDKNRLKKNAALAALLLFAAVLFFSIRNYGQPLSDYGNYYFGSFFFAHGVSTGKLYDPWEFNLLIDQSGAKHLYENYTPVPPLTLAAYLPFVLFTAAVSKIIFMLLSGAFFSFSLYRFLLRHAVPFAFLAVAVLLFPLRANVEAGQSYFLVAGLLLSGWMFYGDKKYLPAALLWALAIHLKVFPGIVFLFLLFEKDWKMIAYLFAAGVAFFLAALPFTGFGVWENYFTEILPRLSVNEINNPFTFLSQSGTTFLRRLFVRDELLNPGAPYNSPSLFYLLNSVYVLLLLLPVAMVSGDKKQNTFAKFSLWLFAGVLVSGYSTEYGLFLLLFPLLSAGMRETKITGRWIAFLVVAAVAASFPVHRFLYETDPVRFSRLWMLLVFFVMMVITLRPGLRFSRAMLFLLLIPVRYFPWHEAEDRSTYFLTGEIELLTGDYNWKNDTLVMQVRTPEGIAQVENPVNETAEEDKLLAVKDGQIFDHGKQVTFSGDHKKKPMRTGDGYIVYLSDKNRGVGFYALRKIKPE